MVISVVWRRLRRGWVRGVGAPHRRLATARADLKASRELAWTMLVLWFVGKKIVCTIRCYGLEFQGSRHGVGIGYGLEFGQCSLGGWRTMFRLVFWAGEGGGGG